MSTPKRNKFKILFLTLSSALSRLFRLDVSDVDELLLMQKIFEDIWKVNGTFQDDSIIRYGKNIFAAKGFYK